MVALLEACDVTNNGRHLGCHLGFYQEIEIWSKQRDMVLFCFTGKITHKKAVCMILATNLLLLLKEVAKTCICTQNRFEHLLIMTLYLITIATVHH